MKKKSVFNNNEVDIDLLFNQPKHLKKMFGKKNSGNVEDIEEEDDEDEDEESETKSLSPQMKKYINDYIDSKKVKKKTNFMRDAIESFSDYQDKTYNKIRDNAENNKKSGIIEGYIKKKLGK